MNVYIKEIEDLKSAIEFQKVEAYTNNLILTKEKYKLMWFLRHLENEINEQGGIIILSIKNIETKGFTVEFTDKLNEVFKIYSTAKD